MENKAELSRLVKAAQDDPKAFAQLYAQTFSYSYAVVKRYLNNTQDIEDVLQSAYMYAAKSLSSLRDPELFHGWMHTILIHECQKCLKANKKQIVLIRRTQNGLPYTDELSVWTDILEKQEISEAVHHAMECLPNAQKMCAALFYGEQRSITEIAEMLGDPEGTIKSRLYHARRKLEKELKHSVKEDKEFLAAAPIPLLCAYFRQSEIALAPDALRERIWAQVHAHNFAPPDTPEMPPGGVGISNAVRAVVIAVTAAAVVGGGAATRAHFRAKSVPAAIMVAEQTQSESDRELTLPSSETQTVRESLQPSSEPAAAPETTAAISERVSTAVQPRLPRQPAATQPNTSVTTVPATTAAPTTTAAPVTTTAQPPTTARPSATTTTAAANTTAEAAGTTASPAPQTAAPERTTARTSAQTNEAPATAAAETSDAQYQMSGGVLRSYTGSDTSLSVPATIDGQSVTAIGSEAFAQSQSLRTLQLPDTVTQIGQLAFSDCTSLQSVQLPSSLQSIGIGAFSGCTSLTSAVIPDGATTIGDDAFSGCTALREVTIPSSVREIGIGVFDGCTGLTIRCAEHSAAQTYAQTHGITYQLSGGNG